MSSTSSRTESLSAILMLGFVALTVLPLLAIVMPELRSDPVFLYGSGLLAVLFVAWAVVGLTSITASPRSVVGKLLCLEFTPVITASLFAVCFLVMGVLESDPLRLLLGLSLGGCLLSSRRRSGEAVTRSLERSVH